MLAQALLLVTLLALFVPGPAPATAATAKNLPPLEALARSYRELAWYEDRGSVEITRFADGAQHVESWRFSTGAAPPDGFRLLVERPPADEEAADRAAGEAPDTGFVLWREGGALYRYDASTETWAEVPSLAATLPDPDLGAALLVPRLLAGGEPPWADQIAVEPAQPCGDGSGDTCRMLSATTGEGRLRLWIEETEGRRKAPEGRVRRLELEREATSEQYPEESGSEDTGSEESEGYVVGSSGSHVWIRVRHEVKAARRTPEPGPDELASLRFEPPPDAHRGSVVREAKDGPPPVPTGVEPIEVYSEQIDVSLFSTSVRVLDRHGRPVPDLRADDFRAWVDDTEVPVTAVDWVRPDQPWTDELELQLSPEQWRELGLIRPDPGQLVVVFVQSDFNAQRIKGHLSFLPNVRSMLRTLAPEDRVAVVAFGSHLELWQDFTHDRDAAYRAIEQAVRFGAVPEVPGPADEGAPSLAEHFRFQAARKAAKVEAGLGVTADALEALSREHPEIETEEKSMIFLGWGIGERTSFGISDNRHELFPAIQSLHRSHTAVHVLDVTPYEVERGSGGVGPAHSLEIGLRNLAGRTGGTFARTYNFPGQAWRGLVQAVSGYYVLQIDGQAIPPTGGLLTIALREKKGRGLAHRPLRIFPLGARPPGSSPEPTQHEQPPLPR